MIKMKVDGAFNIRGRGLCIVTRNPEIEPVMGQEWECNDVTWTVSWVERFSKCLCHCNKVNYGLGMRPSIEGKTLVENDELTFNESNTKIS